MDRAWPVDYWTRVDRLKREGLKGQVTVEFLDPSDTDPLLAIVAKPDAGQPVLHDHTTLHVFQNGL